MARRSDLDILIRGGGDMSIDELRDFWARVKTANDRGRLRLADDHGRGYHDPMPGSVMIRSKRDCPECQS